MLHDIISETINRYINNIIKEYHDQPRLPLFGNGHAYMDEFIDWLQYSSKKGQLPAPTITWEEGVKQGCIRLNKNSKKENGLYATPVAVIERQVERHGIFKYPEFDENGNLYVERKLSINISDLNHASPKLYNDLIQDYEDNVGGCWSWKPGAAAAYCGSDDGIEIKLCGYMYLDDIYWEELIRKATDKNCKHEYEVRTYPRGRVMLTKIIFRDNKNKYVADFDSFDGPRILKQTYFGNNASFQGDYAKIGLQKIGYDKEFIDRQGNEYTRDELTAKGIHFFDKVYDYKNNFAKVEQDGLFNFIDKEGNLVWHGDWFDAAYDFNHKKYAEVEKNGLYNILKSNGELVWKGKQWLDSIDEFEEGFALICIDEKGFNYMDINGELLWKGDKWFETAYNFCCGYAKVENEDDSVNYINEHGQLVSKIWFDYGHARFSEGFVVVYLQDKGYNFMNEKGELFWKNDQWFDKAYEFINDIAQVVIDDKVFFINKKGQLMKS